MATYYIELAKFGLGPPNNEYFWEVTEQGAIRSGTTNFKPIKAVPGENILLKLQDSHRGSVFHELKRNPGEYYPRMARPKSVYEKSPGRNPDESVEFRHSRARSAGQLHAFIGEIERICRVVHPFEGNLQTYGHEIRNILILACTEVEAHWKNILKDNDYTADYERLNTTHYVKLLSPMKLDEYVVQLNYYPWLEPISPFVCWSSAKATKSLSWYDAYNKVKHDREANFAQATLRRALTAVTGCFVMLCAQYGLDFVLEDREAERAFFQLIRAPTWPPSEIYVPCFDSEYRAVHYPIR